MDVTTAARALIGDTLGFHLIFILFGVSLPAIISVAEGIGIWKKQPWLINLARSWSKALVILFIAGAVSGTIVSLQFSLLWPNFTSFAGKVVGISFALEGFAFLVEALFLSVYMLSWDKFKPVKHWLISLPVVLGSVTSAFFITTVNAWMNTPRGFKLDANGNPIDINTRQAVFNPSSGHEIAHSILSYFFATLLVLLAIYAWKNWRTKIALNVRPRLDLLMKYLAIATLVFGMLVVLSGDRSGKALAKDQPYKLAAAEGLYQTQNGAPLEIGGIVSDNQIKGAIKIPKLLSFLATGHFDGKVTGLNDVPKDERPPVVVHYFFDGMVAIGMITVFVPAFYLISSKWKKSWMNKKLMMISLVFCGVLGVLGAELGWMLTEFGRQPFVIRGVMRTTDAATTSQAALHLGYLLPLLYLVLFVVTYKALKKIFKPMEALE